MATLLTPTGSCRKEKHEREKQGSARERLKDPTSLRAQQGGTHRGRELTLGGAHPPKSLRNDERSPNDLAFLLTFCPFAILV